MAQAIHKFMLYDVQNVLTLPKGWLPLSVHNQRGYICVWILLDTDEREKEAIVFYALATGECPVKVDPDTMHFIGTVLVEKGDLVFHVFADTEPTDCGIR